MDASSVYKHLGSVVAVEGPHTSRDRPSENDRVTDHFRTFNVTAATASPSDSGSSSRLVAMETGAKTPTTGYKNWRHAGHLLKYTNVMKGWQSRLITVDSLSHRLYYVAPEDIKRGEQFTPPRAVIDLIGSTVIPSDEDSVSFVLNLRDGDVYRFKGADAKDRQHWVDKIREASIEDDTIQYPIAVSRSSIGRDSYSRHGGRNVSTIDCKSAMDSPSLILDPLHADLQTRQKAMNEVIDLLPLAGPFTVIDKDILTIKSLGKSCVSVARDLMQSLSLDTSMTEDSKESAWTVQTQCSQETNRN